MKKRITLLTGVVFLGSILFYSRQLSAVGINTHVALPVPKNHLLIRTQARYTRSTDDPSGAGRRRHVIKFPTVFVYGATPKTAFFGIFPVAYRDLSSATPRKTTGMDDITLLGRQELFKRDRHLQTFRIALLGGIEIPSGDNPFSSNSIDIPLGIVSSLQTHRQEFDADLRYEINTEGNGLNHGDDFFYNIAYQRRILPLQLPEKGVPNQFNIVLEFNGQWTQKDNNVGGGVVANSGGHTLLLSPGLQFVMKRMIVETSFQYPVVQDLNGTQLKKTFAVNGGMRILF